MRLFLISVLVCAAGLMMASSSASPSDFVWEDPNKPFSEPIEVCSEDRVPDNISVSLPEDYKTVLVVKLRSETWLKSGGPKGYSLFTPWLRVNGKDIRIPVDWFPAEQTVMVPKARKYLKPGDNVISFLFIYDGGNICYVGDTCEGCRYWVEEISFVE